MKKVKGIALLLLTTLMVVGVLQYIKIYADLTTENRDIVWTNSKDINTLDPVQDL